MNEYGNILRSDHSQSHMVLVGVILDAVNKKGRFKAMKELFDIAEKRLFLESTPSEDKLFFASKGIVCTLPPYPASMYEQYDWKPLFEQNADLPACPASTGKLLSLITGLDYLPDLKQRITITEADIQRGSGNYFVPGDSLTIEDLIYGMLLPSSNTCAMTFARVAGERILEIEGHELQNNVSRDDCIRAFRKQMAKKAMLIGATHSSFKSPSGLSKANTTTARDMLRIAVDVCSYNSLLKIWGKKTACLQIKGTSPREIQIQTTVTDKELEEKYVILGGKTGFLIDYANALVMIASFRP